MLAHRDLSDGTNGPLNWRGQQVVDTFVKVHDALNAMVQMDMRQIIENDGGEFNYVFKGMRDDCVYIKHLSNYEKKIS